MPFTAIEKILMNHSVCPIDKVSPGDFVNAHIDFIGVHEGPAFSMSKSKLLEMPGFESAEMTGVFDPKKVGVFLSHHFCIAQSDAAAEEMKVARNWAAKLGIKVFDLGSGICHSQIMEQGIAYPGALLLFGDSHSTAYGAVGAMGTAGAGIDIFLTGINWFKVPTNHKYIIEGKTPKGVYPRDAIQYILGKVGMAASVYSAVEWDGSYIHSLPVPLRFPFTLMAIELGAKTSFIKPDEITLEYLKGRVGKPFQVVESDPDAEFEKTYNFNVSDLEPQVAAPSLPENTKPISEVLGIPIDQVTIGGCTGSSIYDMREAAKILKGRKVKEQVRTLIVPGTREVLRQCAVEGLLQIFADSGANVFPSFCGTCQTFSIGNLAPGETQIHSGPRNLIGRTAMGSYTYLGSPATCAATAIEGAIADPRNYL